MYPKTTCHSGSLSPYKPGDVVQASYAFKKDKYEDLPFSQNDKLKIIGIAKDPNWAHARSTSGETGLIPLNYVHSTAAISMDFSMHSWYHGRISRTESERIIHGYPVGSFLVRDSDLYPGDLTLCLVGPLQPQLTDDDETSTDCRHADSADPAVVNPLRTHAPPTNVQHYHINCKKTTMRRDGQSGSEPVTKYSLDEYDWFPNLSDLIKYYSLPDSGLVAPLLRPIIDLQRRRLNQLKNSGWIIPRCELTLGASIGRGEFGEVHKATYNGQQVAVKIYKKTACKMVITYEASLLTKVDHQNVVAFVGLVYEPDDCIYVLTEYLAHGSLLTYLHSRTRSEISQQTKLQFSVDACLGMKHLERCRIIHRDIAARNILLFDHSNRLTAKVADFGMARHLDEPSPTGSPVGGRTTTPAVKNHSGESGLHYGSTSRSVEYIVLHDNAAIPVKWTAPEAVRDRFFSSKSDVWSFGILMWEIYSHGRIPYPRLMANQVIRQLENGYRMKAPDECSADVYSLMNRLWQLNPDDRPSFSDIVSELTTILLKVAGSKDQLPPITTTTVTRQRDGDDRCASLQRGSHLMDIWPDVTDPDYDHATPKPARYITNGTTMSRSFTSTISQRDTPRSVHAATADNDSIILCLPAFKRPQLS